MMSKVETISAGDVKPGDYIYNKGAYCPGHSWIRVVRVEAPSEGGTVTIETTDWTTYKHCREGIAVKRFGEE